VVQVRPFDVFLDDFEHGPKENEATLTRFVDLFPSETGWDFSSRWLYLDNLSTIHVTDIIPVDLNAIMYANEISLSIFHCAEGMVKKAIGESDLVEMEKSSEYLKAAMNREDTMNQFLWDNSLSKWADYNVVTRSHRNGSF
jgi:alpha,alpha-trehalase